MDGTARDCEPQLMALFMKSPKLTMFYRKFFFRFGKRHIVIHPKQASRSDGWSPSPVVARLTGCAGARLILVRESAMSSESCKARKLRDATRLDYLFCMISAISWRKTSGRCLDFNGRPEGSLF